MNIMTSVGIPPIMWSALFALNGLAFLWQSRKPQPRYNYAFTSGWAAYCGATVYATVANPTIPVMSALAYIALLGVMLVMVQTPRQKIWWLGG